jgi:hypothetical protein
MHRWTMFLVLYAALFSILAYVRYAWPKRLLQQIATRYPDLIRTTTTHWVRVLSHQDLAGGSAALMQRKHGYLLVSGSQATLVIAAFRTQWAVQEFLPAQTHIAFIDNRGIAPGLPSFVRLSTGAHSSYVAVVAPWGSCSHARTTQLFQTLALTFPTPPWAGHTRRPHLLARLALATLAVGMLSMLVVTGWAVLSTQPIYAPHVLAELPDQSVLIAGDADLFRLSTDGTLLEQRALSALGVPNGITAIQVESPHTVLLGNRQHRTIMRCQMRTWHCQVLPGMAQGSPLFEDVFTFAVDAAGARLFASDVRRHRILELDRNGQPVRTVLTGETLCFPNQVTVWENQLYVVNTNHHKLQWFTLDERPQLAGEWHTVEEAPLQVECIDPDKERFRRFFRLKPRQTHGCAFAHAVASPGRVWPIAAQRDVHGAWWVLNAASRLTHADVLRFDAQGNNPTLILSGKRHDPIAVLPRAHDVLVADLTKPSIRRFDLAGAPLGEFGDNAFRQQLITLRERQQQLTFSYAYSFGGGALVTLLGAGLLMVATHQQMRRLAEHDPAWR